MPDHGSFARQQGGTMDPRRAHRLADRIAAGHVDPLGRSLVPPGIVTADQASVGQLIASGVNFDRAGFAFDVTNHGPFTVNGAGDAITFWTKVGANANNLRCPLGALDRSVYVWVWASVGWSLSSAAAAADSGRIVAVLYDSLSTSAKGIVRASNPTSNWVPKDDNFRQISYIGFLAVNPDAFSVADDGFTGEGDWNVGIQMQYSGTQKVTTTTINRQSITVFVSDFPFDGATNYEFDALA